jgi:arylsulfatase A-like enzyme
LAAYGYRLDSEFTTLAEVLKAEGYVTAAASGSRAVVNITGFGCESGIDQGFDIFYSKNRLKTDAKSINQFAIPWLRANSNSNFFLWLHYFDTHAPYVPPTSYAEKFYDKDNPIIVSLESIPYSQKRVHGDINDLNFYIAQYDGEINFVDAHVGKLLDELSKLGLLDKTLIVITADHGENLGEHDIFFAHCRIYETSLHIPLIISGPNIPSKKRIEGMVQSIDIMPTLLDILGISVNINMEGASLVPLIYGEREEIHKEVFSESINNERKAIKIKDWKLIYELGNKKLELFNLKNDPNELNNVVDRFPLVAKDLKERLEKFMNSSVYSQDIPNQIVDEAHRKSLKSLGYIQ